MKRNSEPLFLARRIYRRRRLMDALRLIPILGVFLFFLPLLWGQGAPTSVGVLYIFAAWAFLIFAVYAASTAIARTMVDNPNDDP